VLGPVLADGAPPDKLPLEADKTFRTAASVFYDAIFIPDGEDSLAMLETDGDAVHFVQEAYKHYKAIAAIGDAAEMVVFAEIDDAVLAAPAAPPPASPAVVSDLGVVTTRDPSAAAELAAAFIQAIAKHRHWDRDVSAIPA